MNRKDNYTAKTLIEALGALYILCVYGYCFHKSKYKTLEVILEDDELLSFPLRSQVFRAVPLRTTFKNFSHFDNSAILNIDLIPKKLLIAKEDKGFIDFLYQKEKDQYSQVLEAVIKNRKFLDFIAEAQFSDTPIVISLGEYAKIANDLGDLGEEKWAIQLIKKCIDAPTTYFSTVGSKQGNAALKLKGQAPQVYLNTYTHALDIPKSNDERKLSSIPKATLDEIYTSK